MKPQDANRARAALAYVDQKLQGLIEYATFSCLDDFVPELQSTLATMRKLASTPTYTSLRGVKMFFAAGPQEKVEKVVRRIVDDVIDRASDTLGGVKTLHDLHVATGQLREQIETLKIEKGRREEEFARKEREVEHKVGLERKRQEFELESGKREATLKVREENLAADRKRFEEQMKFHEERFSQEVGYLKDLLGQIMERLPSAEIALTGTVAGKRGR